MCARSAAVQQSGYTQACLIAHLATIGVNPRVSGARTGISALLHRNAKASDELGPVSRLENHPRSLGSASSLTSLSVMHSDSVCYSSLVCLIIHQIIVLVSYLTGAHT